jgi:hypothetical protein
MNTVCRLASRLPLSRAHPVRRALAYEVAGTITEEGKELRSWGTLRHQNELPKQVLVNPFFTL